MSITEMIESLKVIIDDEFNRCIISVCKNEIVLKLSDGSLFLITTEKIH